jgi:hypothetical protein
MKVVNRTERWIGYRINILGVRVWENACQLVAKNGNGWETIGPRWDLPVHVPRNAEELKAAGADTVRLTAYQYDAERPGSDIVEVLAKTKDFESALTTGRAVAAAEL